LTHCKHRPKASPIGFEIKHLIPDRFISCFSNFRLKETCETVQAWYPHPMQFTKRTFLFASLSLTLALGSGCESPYVKLPRIAPVLAPKPAAGELLVYIGTYTRGASEGIYAYRMDLKTGQLTSLGLAAGAENPAFVAINPENDTLYAVNEISNYEGKSAGSVSAYLINRNNGELEYLNTQSSQGAGPCHLSIDASGRNVLVANYGGGSVACLPVGENGELKEASSFIQHQGSSINPRRQKGPHAHSVNLGPANKYAFVADLGMDQVLTYRLNASKGKLTAGKPPFTRLAKGAGPRHFAFHPSGRLAYVINEMHCTVTAFQYDHAGRLTERQSISTLDVPVQPGYSTAEVQVHPGGRFLYGSNRGHDSISVFTIDEVSGRLNRVQVQSTLGTTPRNFGIDPTGNYLIAANQNSDNLVVFRIDQKTGKLTSTGVEVECPSPVCVKFLSLN
jgi:6-phosphogluconolactonase